MRRLDPGARTPTRVRRQFQRMEPHVQEIPAGQGTYVIQHGRHTREVDVYVYQAVSPYERQSPRVQHTTSDTVTLLFGGGLPATACIVKVSSF